MTKRREPWFRKLGPGLITGAADEDPSGITTYSQSGAKYGTGMLWTVFATFPLLVSVQEMAARIGLVTGKGLIGNIQKYYPRLLAYIVVLLVCIANIANLGADLGAISASVQLFVPVPLIITTVVVSITVTVLTIYIPYKKYANILKFLTFSLLAYFITGMIVAGDFRRVLYETFVPHITFDRGFLFVLVGVVGTTISPYVMFWQANEEVEEELSKHISPHDGTNPRVKSLISSMRLDTWLGMAISGLTSWFIILTTARTLNPNGITDILSASDAAFALEPLVGQWAKVIFALGIIGTGLLAIPIFAAANAYALSELFGWSEGLNKKLKNAKKYYLVVAASIFVGALMMFLRIDPMKALVYVAVLNGIISVPLIGTLLLLGNNKKIMGEYTNPWWVNLFSGIAFVIMGIGAIAMFIVH